MMRLFLASCFVVAGYATIPFEWRDCSPAATQVIKVKSITATPGELRAPGELHLSFTAKVTQQISLALIKFEFNRFVLGHVFHIPCVNNLGSCTYDACSFLSNISASTEQGRNVSQQITSMFSNVGASISCPIPAQEIAVTDFLFRIPKLSGAQDLIADGDYNIKVQIIQPGTQAQLICLQFNTTVVRTVRPIHYFLFN